MTSGISILPSACNIVTILLLLPTAEWRFYVVEHVAGQYSGTYHKVKTLQLNWRSDTSIWVPWEQGSWGQHGAHLGPTRPRWAPCWPHELCYLGWFCMCVHIWSSKRCIVVQKDTFKQFYFVQRYSCWWFGDTNSFLHRPDNRSQFIILIFAFSRCLPSSVVAFNHLQQIKATKWYAMQINFNMLRYDLRHGREISLLERLWVNTCQISEVTNQMR